MYKLVLPSKQAWRCVPPSSALSAHTRKDRVRNCWHAYRIVEGDAHAWTHRTGEQPAREDAEKDAGQWRPRVRTDRDALSVDVPSWPGRLRTLEPVVQPASCSRIVSRRRAGQGVRRRADAATKVGEKALVDRRPGPLRDPRRQRRCFPGRPHTQSRASATGRLPFPPSPHSRVHRVQGPSHHSRSLSGRGGVAPFPEATSQVHAGANNATDVLASRITSSALRGTHR